MFQKLSISAAALAAVGFVGAASAAQDAILTNGDTITINGEVVEYIVLDITEPTIDYTVGDLADSDGLTGGDPVDDGEDKYAGTNEKANFVVNANVPYTITVLFDTWDYNSLGYEQAEFTNADGDRIGGSLHLDPTPDSIASGNSDIIYQTSAGLLTANGSGGSLDDWGLGANFRAEFTDHPSGLAPAGDYTLVATVEVSAQ